MKCCIVWFRRDLRLADNPALARALEDAESVVPVYVHAPDEEHPWEPGAASRWWLHHSLAALDRELRARGARLIVRQASSLPGLLSLARETGAQGVYWNRLYEPAVSKRDRAVERGLREAGLAAESFNAALLFEPCQVANAQGAAYRMFTPFWRACARHLGALPPIRPAPSRIRMTTAGSGDPFEAGRLDELGLLPRIPWDSGFRIRDVGEVAALARLERFHESSLATYADRRDRPDLEGGSRLSPHLHFGEIGPRQVTTRVLQRAAAHAAAGEERGAQTFLKEMGWREFAHHLLHHFPHTPERPLDTRFERFAWRSDAAAMAAWQQGRTGVPIVDAGMRELRSSGWMHNRVRMIAASFLTKNLGIHWHQGARWFWDTLVDADLANNTLGWQWTAGCGADAAPFVRVFNPVLQAERFDPARAYIRRWLPEIAALPDAIVHRPWMADEATLAAAGVRLGHDYPRPVVDLAASRRAALQGYAAVRAALR